MDINEVVSDTDRLFRRLLGADIELETVVPTQPARTRLDVGQLEHVMMNLLVNARDAMPHGGTLSIATASVKLEADYAARHPGAHAGWHVMLAISDTGTGMDAATRQRVFEPFFTTKERGQGTGLGLPMVLSIVQQSGGHLELDSTPGVGTTFKLFFSATDEPITAEHLSDERLCTTSARAQAMLARHGHP